MDIRVLETKSSQIVAVASAVGKASSVGLAWDKAADVLPMITKDFSKTLMEKAIRG